MSDKANSALLNTVCSTIINKGTGFLLSFCLMDRCFANVPTIEILIDLSILADILNTELNDLRKLIENNLSFC